MSLFRNAKPRLAFLISGRGSNMMAVLKKIKENELKAEPVIVFSNKASAAGLEKARESGVPTETFSPKQFTTKDNYEERLVELLKEKQVDYIICAGYMRILGKPVLHTFKNRILNIHPSILPAFPGLNAQKQAIEAGVKVSGCTIHFVDDGVDTGPIIMQRTVEVSSNDTEESLSKKIIKIEHDSYWRAIKLVLKGYQITGRTVSFEKAR